MFGAFGNPYLSNNPVTDGNTIFQSQADQYGNSFASPMNSANMNSGWGIDPSLLTPSFQAGYRPQYSGPQPTNLYGRRTTAQAAWALSPFSTDLRWGNPVSHNRQPIEDITGRPADATMWGIQRIGMPILSYGLGNMTSKALGLGWKSGSRIGANFVGGLAEGFGAARPINAATGAAMGVRDVWGAARAGYLANGFEGAASAFEGISAGGAANLAFRGIGGTVVGAAASAASGLILGQALMYGAEKSIFEPYVNMRKTSRDLRDNFAGVTFADARGNAVSGRGLGMEESYRMASEITRQGVSDMTFSTGEYARGASLIMRSGLTDNVSKGQIPKRIKDVMEQVKMIQAIGNMPELKDAIAEIAKLNDMGVGVGSGAITNASGVYGKLGMFASMAGASVQRIMNTVGAQGQYLYQANGMTPYMGQLAAAGVYSSFAAGQRMGVLSQATIAKMGGIEGGTQGSLTGQINAMQTTFSKMALLNQAHGGQGFAKGGNTVNVVSDFNRRMVNDPLGTMGEMELFSSELAGQELTKKGSRAVQEQLRSIVANQPGILDPVTHKLSYSKAVPYLEQMGFSIDQIKDYYNQLAVEQDRGAYAQGMKSVDAQSREQYRQYITNNKLYDGAFGSAIYNFSKGGRAVMAEGSDLVHSGLSKVGVAGDSISRFTDRLVYGSDISRVDKTTISEMMGGAPKKVTDNVDLFDINADKIRGHAPGFGLFLPGAAKDVYRNQQVMAEINDLASDKNAAGNEEAVRYLQDKNSSTKLTNLQKVLEFTSLRKDYLGNDNEQLHNLGSLSDMANAIGRKTTDVTKVNKDKSFRAKQFSGEEYGAKVASLKTSNSSYYDKLTKMSGRVTNDSDREENETLAGIASDLALKYSDVGEFSKARAEGTDEDLKKYDSLISAGLKGKTSDTDLYSRIRDAAAYSKQFGGTEFNLIMKGSLLGDDDKELTGEARLRKAMELSGGRFKNGMANALSLSRDEVINGTAIDKQAADMKLDLEGKFHGNLLDINGFKESIQQIEANGILKKIEENTKKMADKVSDQKPTDGGTSNQSPAAVGPLDGIYKYFGVGQKTTQTAGGR